ncbi:hypothetical protein F5051DRAFT_309102, partial [Lentinula edodes]
LTPGYAFTDYKGQGQTLEYIIVDLERPCGGPDINPFSTYVALLHSPALREEDLRLDFITMHTERWWKEGRR